MATLLSRVPARIRVVEVGPRDGLQNEAALVKTADKVAFIDALAAAGLNTVEATSFVSPKAVPQLADAADVMQSITRRKGTRYPVLVPNERGYERTRAANCDAIALFTAASERFSQENVRATIDETFERFRPVSQAAHADGVWVRGYVSTATDCPYTGHVEPVDAVMVAERLFELGCHEVALADTIGKATPARLGRLLELAVDRLPVDRLALHLHDTGGLALANVMIGLEYGISIFDAAAGGLGGCPFAPGAPGNLSTEQLLRLLHGLNIETGVDEAAVRAAVAALRDRYAGLGNRAADAASEGMRPA